MRKSVLGNSNALQNGGGRKYNPRQVRRHPRDTRRLAGLVVPHQIGGATISIK